MSFKGTNKLGSYETFVSRTLYNCYAFSRDGHPEVNPPLTQNFHFLEKLFYGRVNRAFYAIEPLTSRMENLSSNTSRPIMVLDFVADSFRRLQNEFKLAFDRDELSADSSIGDPRAGVLPVIGASDPKKQYQRYIQDINVNFLDNYINETRKLQIRSFEDFFPIYMSYLKTIMVLAPYTKNAYITSTLNSPLNSGLSVEIAEYDHGSDKEKYDLFIQDENFKFYQVTAAKYGFVIDKNAPWRLNADINPDSAMMQYASIRNSRMSTEDDILGYYYRLVYDEDLDNIKRSFVSAYNAFARSNPVFYEKKLEEGCITTHAIRPPIENISSVLARFDDLFWLEHYITIRNLESKLNYSQASLAKIIKNSKELAKEFDIRKAMGYIERKFNGFMHHEGSLFYEASKINAAEEGTTPGAFSKEVKQAVKTNKRKIY